jgi:peptide methionine sulfoxide reductase msrA/msrB
LKSPELTPFERFVIENKGTEPPFTGLFTTKKSQGTYHCKRCNQPLYTSEHKFASSCGWPSFDDEIQGAIKRLPDPDGRRIEIICSKCEAHLGHVFKGEFLTPKNLRHCVNSVSLNFVPKETPSKKTVILASGCFWGTQHFLSRITGVIQTQVGYTGGHVDQPTYQQVCSGTTGHVEAVLVEYDPSLVSFEEILRVYFETHDFSQADGQGPDIGPQYLSVAFYETPEEKSAIESLISLLNALGHRVVTQVKPRAFFWTGEEYHQNYYERKGETPYCHIYRPLFARAHPGIKV